MGIKLRDYFPPDDEITFTDITAFWDIAMIGMVSDSLGRYPKSEEEFMDYLSDKGRNNYFKAKEENPDWDFPKWLNREDK